MKCFLILYLILPLVLTSKLVELQVKTRDIADAGMNYRNGSLGFTFCDFNNPNYCCTITQIHSSLDIFQPGHLDDFTEELYDCYGMEINENEFWYLPITHWGSDAWFGQYARILLDSGIYFHCPISEWMEYDFESKNIHCTIGIPDSD